MDVSATTDTAPRRNISHRTLWHSVFNGGKVVELKLHFPHVARQSLFQLHKSYVLWGFQVLCTRSSLLTLTKKFGMGSMKLIRCGTSIAYLLGVDVIRQPNRFVALANEVQTLTSMPHGLDGQQSERINVGHAPYARTLRIERQKLYLATRPQWQRPAELLFQVDTNAIEPFPCFQRQKNGPR
jgi:hypothetical protein